METKLQLEIKNVLNQFPEYWESNSLLKNKVIDDLRNYKKELIQHLLSNEMIKNTYSLQLDNGTVFKVEDFISMLRYKNYWENSYTKYSNDIGLTSGDKYLKYNSDVVLDFPHKDCVLEAGMTKEDVGKKEEYYHKIIAKEEIDIMLSPKVLSNMKKYDENGEQEITDFIHTDNLILKGNNLIALHTLKERFINKVKLIFIDPPYNTGGDSFKYNDKFNHSTWLTFMKNRLEIARDLLSEDGSIWISIDDDEAHYLKVLCDEIFGRNNFVNNVIWEKKFSPQNDATWLSDSHDHILVFAKNKEIWRPNPLPRSAEMDSRYKNPDNDSRGPWTSGDLLRKDVQKSGLYKITTPSGRICEPPSGTSWRIPEYRYYELLKENRLWFGKDGKGVPRLKRFLSEVKSGVTAKTIWKHDEVGNNQGAKREVNKIEDIDSFATPKPERLLQRIIHLGSNEKDIVLDFFMGSATTQAVAMKMNRQFIGIEQMDYINTVSAPRLKKVIEGEQGGISKDVEWAGGSSFVYTELYQLNQKYVDQVQKVTSDKEIEKIIDDIKESAFLDFKINIDKLTNKNSDFASLTLEEKKAILIQSLDANQMYLNYSEIDDSQYDIPEYVKQFNHSFYNKQKDVKNHD